MQVIDNSVEQYPHFFFQGYRVPVGGSYPETEQVGVLAIKQTVNLVGEVTADKEILLTDTFFEPTNPPPPPPLPPPSIRMESDLAMTKPGLDIIIVRDEDDLPDYDAVSPDPGVIPPEPDVPLPGPGIFGDIEISRTTGVSQTLPSVIFGWYPRTQPQRIARAGDEAALEIFPDNSPNSDDILPKGFENLFFNGARITTLQHLVAGDSVTLIENDDAGNPTGVSFSVVVPDNASLSFTRDNEPLNPQPSFTLDVDTLLFDMLSSEFLLTWRAVFNCDESLELAVLEIN